MPLHIENPLLKHRPAVHDFAPVQICGASLVPDHESFLSKPLFILFIDLWGGVEWMVPEFLSFGSSVLLQTAINRPALSICRTYLQDFSLQLRLESCYSFSLTSGLSCI